MSIRFARHQAEKLIQELKIEGPRVDVEAVAEALGLPVYYDDLGDPSVSGLLVSDGEDTAIFIKHDDAHWCIGFQFVEFGCGMNAGTRRRRSRSIVFERVNSLKDIILVDSKIIPGKIVYDRAVLVRNHYI